MSLRDRLRRWRRGEPSQATRVIDVRRAVVSGDECDAAKAAEKWAVAEREREELEREDERRAAIARQISETVRREGLWLPPSRRHDDFGRFGR